MIYVFREIVIDSFMTVYVYSDIYTILDKIDSKYGKKN